MMTNLGYLFQHTAARRRLVDCDTEEAKRLMVSTHSRPKAAGNRPPVLCPSCEVSTHSRPKAAGYRNNAAQVQNVKFQHTAARRRLGNSVVWCRTLNMFQHTAARRRLGPKKPSAKPTIRFQHTAARRRLDHPSRRHLPTRAVSTHSRPKAAGT